VNLLSETLKILILPLPKDATTIDTYYARLLCKLFQNRGWDLNIFFIKAERKEELLSKIFRKEKKTLKKIIPASV
jgi:hypothetical protein